MPKHEETAHGVRRAHHRATASMRPRAEARGNILALANTPQSETGFNEASCRSTRKLEAEALHRVARRVASMRPRAEARGNEEYVEGKVAEARLQ